MAYNYGDYNSGGLKTFALAILFFGYVTFFTGIKLDNNEPEKGTGEAVEQKQAAAPSGESFNPSAVKEPWVSTPELVAYGKTIYTNNCAMCHGPEGHGDGVASKGLVPPPRNLVEGKWKTSGSEVALFKVVTEGISGSSMAPWGHLPEVDRWATVLFIQSITKNKVAKPDELKEFIASQKK